jgi:NAD(P)-dependent dehydrogenase (short-subunit alcohol dehydrogenase family)
MPTALITGTNRGIGLELVRQYASDGWQVFATCRDPERAPDLLRLSQDSRGLVTVLPLDVSNQKQIETLSRQLGSVEIDLLFNNAGVYGPTDSEFGNSDVERWMEALRINTVAPMKIMEAFVDQVAASKLRLIANMSSKMGSMADNGSGGSYIYRSTKAALNAVVVSAAHDLKARGITAVAMHPGWVRTDMGGPNGEISVEQSAAALRRILAEVNLGDSGKFFDIDGSLIPW